MEKRKYIPIKMIEDQIQLMRADEMTNREIADHFGLKLKQGKNGIGITDRRRIFPLESWLDLREGLGKMVNPCTRMRRERLIG